MNFLANRHFRNRVISFIERHPKAVLAGIAIYIISPIDLLPEAFLGPIGTFDDILAFIVGVAIVKHMRKKRAEQRTLAPVAEPAPQVIAPKNEPPRRDDHRFRRNDRRPRPGGRR